MAMGELARASFLTHDQTFRVPVRRSASEISSPGGLIRDNFRRFQTCPNASSARRSPHPRHTRTNNLDQVPAVDR